jgi:predicted N-acetyltransferase YhbS
MTITSKTYDNGEHHDKVMSFLRKTFTETHRLENWLPPRFENNSRDMDPGIHLWMDEEDLIGLAIPESPQVYFCSLHSRYADVYSEMITWIERYTEATEDKSKKLTVVELEGVNEREQLLLDKGFTRGSVYGILRIRDTSKPIPHYTVPPSFSIRSATIDDYDELAGCVRQVFGHGEWFTRDVLITLSNASFYKPDLDLVAVDESGKIVSFCTFRLDSPSGITELEPMGTLSDYRNKGIGWALICEGLRRLNRYHPSLIYIGGAADMPAANRLYEVTGFAVKYNLYRWEKNK